MEEKDFEIDHCPGDSPAEQTSSFKKPSLQRKYLRQRTVIDENGSMERKSVIPKLKFGELKPETVPVFGYPFVNYSPTNKDRATGVDQGKECSDKLWQVFSKAIIYQANCTSNQEEDQKMLLAEMID